MRIAITGASGFVCQEIYDVLRQRGLDIILIGRDAERLRSLYPDAQVADYTALDTTLQGCQAVLHLAARNNDGPHSPEDYHQTNVTFLRDVALQAKAAGVRTFINLTSFHALNGTDAYARSKREGDAELAKIEGMNIISMRIPAVYGSLYKGNLAILYKLPKRLRPLGFQVLAALRPTLNAQTLAASLADLVQAEDSAEILLSDGQQGNYVFHGVKRVIDLLFACTVLVVFWWLLLGSWVMVKLTSKGPAIFSQPRIGKNGIQFLCHKFRTMVTGTRQAATHELTASSVTKVGSVLRRVKIDELPQIWNLFRNDMSLVNPRPCLPVQEELIKHRRDAGVLTEKPGITGWAQIHGIDMSDPQRLARKDAEYLMLRTIPLDFQIILATLVGRGNGDRTG